MYRSAHGFDDASAIASRNQATAGSGMLNRPRTIGMALSFGHTDYDFAGGRRRRVGQRLQLENLGRLAEWVATMAFMMSLQVEMLTGARYPLDCASISGYCFTSISSDH
jgi:hypothetical protein